MSLLSACGDYDNAGFDNALQRGVRAEVTVQGRVTRLLADGLGEDGPVTHQRFDVDVDGHTVEVDHNLTLAPRVPLAVGETVVVQGQFEPDPGRPVIHYTHHATSRHQGGFVEVGGRLYD